MIPIKEFTYLSLDDYLEKADKYDEPKIIKIVEVSVKEDTGLYSVKAMTYLRTALICWEGKGLKKDEVESLKKQFREHKHAEGRVVEVTGIKF